MRLTAGARLLSTAMLLCVLAGCAHSPGRGGTTPADVAALDAAALDGFCARAQATIVSSAVQATVVRHADYDAFVKSKPEARPLRVEQYAWADPADPGRMRMISCKMKTADHLVAEYGAGAAGDDRGCAAINRDTVERVVATLGTAERRRLRYAPEAIVHDPEELTTHGPTWLEPYAFAYVGPDGRLHLKAKAMRNDWLDPRYRDAPPRFKGTRYCHLVAPGHLRRILLGETAAGG